MFETSSTGLLEIFSGSTFASGLAVYDIYADFLVANVRAYHRIALIYADGPESSGWYVLDPLRALMTVEPQTLSEYLEDYGEDMDVHWYIGYGYSPLNPDEPVVMTGQLMEYFEGLEDVVEEGTGDVEIIEEIVEEEVIEVVEVET
ncbi:hypothetical protein KKG31_03070 [Patescibacteria group bacterium]|nr:hypothetical protein [Patescibacteria group bacterium]MBU1758142.1 hypothetical protein [Patescibacteria group bacterium]